MSNLQRQDAGRPAEHLQESYLKLYNTTPAIEQQRRKLAELSNQIDLLEQERASVLRLLVGLEEENKQ